MPTHSHQLKIIFALSLFFYFAVFIVNCFGFGYSGITYVYPGFIQLYTMLILIASGLKYLQNGDGVRLNEILKNIICFYSVMFIMQIGATAVQYTPFSTIDQQIFNAEQVVKINYNEILSWSNTHTIIKEISDVCYKSLGLQLVVFPLIISFISTQKEISKTCFITSITCIIGFSFYYFFPTTAPASIIDSPYFSPDQIATHIKFWQIHHHIPPESDEGGMIAMPSFHVIWAIILTMMFRPYPIAFYFLTFVNTMMCLSTVLLGWHYISDVFASILVVMLGYWIYNLTHLKVLELKN